MSNIIFEFVLPAVLFLMMFTMGLSLTLADFQRVFKFPKAVGLGLFNQLLVLPCVAFSLVAIFDLAPELAIGMMILSACPGGIVSNAISYFGKADVALSISLTAIVSLIALITMPTITAFAVSHFGASDSMGPFPYLTLMTTLMLITVIPVSSGMLLRAQLPSFAERALPLLDKVTGLLFLGVVCAAVINTWDEAIANLPALGLVLVSLGMILLLWGVGTSKLFGLPAKSGATIAFETSIQNVATAILIGGTVLQNPGYYLPAALYGIIMYIPAGILVFYMRRRFSDSEL